MDHNPPLPPPDPMQPPLDHPYNASPQLNSTANHDRGHEEGSAQQNSLQMKNFRALVFKFIKPLTPADESLIEQRLRDFFPAVNITPDHPPYSAMIEEAVEKLNGGQGSSEEAISEYIKNEYNSLPWAHPTIVAHHLNKLIKKGDIIVRCERGYILRSAIISSNPCPSHSISSDYSPYSTSSSSSSSSSSSGSDSPTPRRRRLKRKMKRKKGQIHGSGSGRPRMPIPSRGPGRPRKKDEIEKFKRKMMIQTRETGGSRFNGEKWGRPRKKRTDVGEEHQVLEEDNQLVELENVVDDHKEVADIKENNEVRVQNRVMPISSRGPGRPRKKDEIEKFKQKMMIQTTETDGSRKTINGKKWGRPRKKQIDVGEEHQVLEEDNQLVELENVVEDHNKVKDIEIEEINENNEVRVKNKVVLEQSNSEEQKLSIRSEQQGRGAVKKRKNQKKQEKVISLQINTEERQNDGLEENEQSAEEVTSVPDHPPYAAMIEEAIEKLNEGRGSSEEAISGYIKNEYNGLPWAHPILLAHHLKKLSKKGDIIMRCEQGFILRSAIISSTTESDYRPSSSTYSSSSGSYFSSSSSLDSDDSPGSDSSTRRRPLKRTRNRKKSQIQGRGRPRRHIPGRGKGRPRKKDEIDGQFLVHDEKLKRKRKRKRRIQKREKGGSQKTIQGRKRGRPRKNNDTSDRYQEEQTDVAEEHLHVIKEVNQSVELKDAIEDHNQVVDMRMEEIKENNDFQVQNQVVSEQSKAEEQQNDGGAENEEAAEKEVIVDQNQPWKEDDKVIAGEDQREELLTYNGDEQDVVMVQSVAQADEIFVECSRQQKQEKEASVEQNQSEAKSIFQEQYGSIEQLTEVLEEQIHPFELNAVVSRKDQQRELEFEVTERECQEKERHNEIAREGGQLEFEVSEGQCREGEQQTEVIQVEIQLEDKVVERIHQEDEQQNEVVPEGLQPEDKVIGEQQDVQMIMTEAEEDGEVEGWNGQRKQDKGGSIEHNESEKEETHPLVKQFSHQKQLLEKSQQCKLQEQDPLHIQRVEGAEKLRQGEELQETDTFKEKILQQKQLDLSEDRVQQYEKQEKEIEEQDQLQRQKVELAEEVHQLEELHGEVIMFEEIEDGSVEKLSGQQKQVKRISLVQKEVEEQLDDVIGEQVQPEGKCMEGNRENIQPCEQEEIRERIDHQEEKIQTCEQEETTEQQDRKEEQIQPCEQEDDCLVKPETERLHQQEESAGEVAEEQQDLGAIRSEEEGGSAEEWSEKHHEEEKGERTEVNHLEEHENDVRKEQHLAQEQCSEGNKAKIQACKLSQWIIMEPKEQKEQEVDQKQHREEQHSVEAFEKENKRQGECNVVNVERLQSCDVRGYDSKYLPCKAFWSLMEDEKDEFLNNFRDQEMKSQCQEGEISDSSIMSKQEQTELPLLKSSPISHIEEVSYLQSATSHTEKGGSSELKIYVPCTKEFPLPDHHNKSEQRRSVREGLRPRSRNDEVVLAICAPCTTEFPLPNHHNNSDQRRSVREGLRPRSRNVDEGATSERQPVRRSPRHHNINSDAVATTEELDISKERPKRPGLRSERNKKAGV